MMPSERSSRPSTDPSVRGLLMAGVGVVAVFVQLPIVKMILDDPQVRSLASWNTATFLLFSAITFIGLPLAVGLGCAWLGTRNPRMGQAAVLGLMCYLAAMQINRYYLLVHYPTAGWRQSATVGIFVALLGLLWRVRQAALETLKTCGVFGGGIFLVFAYAAAPFRIAGSSAPTGPAAAVAARHVAPVFVLTFEKIVATFLTGPDGRVLADRFPHLADFARTADVYSNAYPNSSATAYALKSLYSGCLTTVERNWARHANLRDLLGAERPAVMLLETTLVRYCRPSRDTCIRTVAPDSTAGIDIIASWYKMYVHAVIPNVLVSKVVGEGWSYDPQSSLWALEAIALEPGERLVEKVGVRQFENLIKVVRREGRSPHLYIMHNWMTDKVPVAPATPTGPMDMSNPQNLELARAALAHFDRQLGTFFDALKEVGIYDESLILITADTGYYPQLRFLTVDWELPLSDGMDEMLRVFLAIKRPGQRAGRVIQAPIRHIDVLPTLLEDLGMDPGAYQFDGVPVTDPLDRTSLIQRPLQLMVPTLSSGIVHYELTDPHGPLVVQHPRRLLDFLLTITRQ